jgi:hypothetical protein
VNILETLLDRGFEFRTLPAYPRHVGVTKYHCAALLELTPEGKLNQFSSAGYLLDSGEIALLVQRQEKPIFVYKSHEFPADEQLMFDYRRFTEELRTALAEQ